MLQGRFKSGLYCCHRLVQIPSLGPLSCLIMHLRTQPPLIARICLFSHADWVIPRFFIRPSRLRASSPFINDIGLINSLLIVLLYIELTNANYIQITTY